MARAMVGLCCGSFRQVLRRIVLDVDDTFDAIHGEQQLRLFNAHSDQYGFQPTVVFDGEGRPVAAMLRRHTEFYDGAGSGSQGERIIARIEARPQGTGTRFVVTNLPGGSAHALYERRYCPRDQAENHLQAWKRHLAADRTSCCRATANQFRLMLHTGAYWLFWSLRSLMPKRSTWRTAQFDTLRLHLVKLATQVIALKTWVMLTCPAPVRTRPSSASPSAVCHA